MVQANGDHEAAPRVAVQELVEPIVSRVPGDSFSLLRRVRDICAELGTHEWIKSPIIFIYRLCDQNFQNHPAARWSYIIRLVEFV